MALHSADHRLARLDEPAAPLTLAPRVPVDLSRLTMSLLSKSPERRPDSAQVVADELRQLLAAETRPTLVPTDTQPRPRRAHLVAVLLGFLTLATGLAIYQLRYATPNGTLVVEIDDPAIERMWTT